MSALNLDSHWQSIISMAEAESRRKPGKKDSSPVYPKPLLPKAAALVTFARLNNLPVPGYRNNGYDYADLDCQIVPTMRYEDPKLLRSQIVSFSPLWYVCVAVDLIGRFGRIVGYAHREDVRGLADGEHINGDRLMPWKGLPFSSPTMP